MVRAAQTERGGRCPPPPTKSRSSEARIGAASHDQRAGSTRDKQIARILELPWHGSIRDVASVSFDGGHRGRHQLRKLSRVLVVSVEGLDLGSSAGTADSVDPVSQDSSRGLVPSVVSDVAMLASRQREDRQELADIARVSYRLSR